MPRQDREERYVPPGLEADPNEPPVPEIDPRDLPRPVKAELKGLPKELADVVGAYLVAAGNLLDEDPMLAYQHAEAARRRASRLPVAREAAAETAYAAGLYDVARNEFRALRRMTGSSDFIPVLADCERALGSPQKALALVAEGEQSITDPAMLVELTIVQAGARDDMGQHAEALRLLAAEIERPRGQVPKPSQARLRYAYGTLLLAAGQEDAAREWFVAAVRIDPEGTDALDRLDELDGVVLTPSYDDLTDEDGAVAVEDEDEVDEVESEDDDDLSAESDAPAGGDEGHGRARDESGGAADPATAALADPDDAENRDEADRESMTIDSDKADVSAPPVSETEEKPASGSKRRSTSKEESLTEPGVKSAPAPTTDSFGDPTPQEIEAELDELLAEDADTVDAGAPDAGAAVEPTGEKPAPKRKTRAKVTEEGVDADPASASAADTGAENPAAKRATKTKVADQAADTDPATAPEDKPARTSKRTTKAKVADEAAGADPATAAATEKPPTKRTPKAQSTAAAEPDQSEAAEVGSESEASTVQPKRRATKKKSTGAEGEPAAGEASGR